MCWSPDPVRFSERYRSPLPLVLQPATMPTPHQFVVGLIPHLCTLNVVKFIYDEIWSSKCIRVIDNAYSLEELILKIIEIVRTINLVNQPTLLLDVTLAVSELLTLCEKIKKNDESRVTGNEKFKIFYLELLNIKKYLNQISTDSLIFQNKLNKMLKD